MGLRPIFVRTVCQKQASSSAAYSAVLRTYRNFQVLILVIYCLIINVLLFCSLATAHLDYHICFGLSTTFLKFLFSFFSCLCRSATKFILSSVPQSVNIIYAKIQNKESCLFILILSFFNKLLQIYKFFNFVHSSLEIANTFVISFASSLNSSTCLHP